MIIILLNPLSSKAGGGYCGGGYSGWWAPWVVIGGAAVLSAYYAPYYYAPYYYPTYYYPPHYYAPYYYAPQPMVIQEQSSLYVQSASSAPLSLVERIFVYPRQGQSEDLQAKDRYECHDWARSQTHYDPTQSYSGMPEAQLIQMRSDYQRAMGACLDGRGYTVK